MVPHPSHFLRRVLRTQSLCMRWSQGEYATRNANLITIKAFGSIASVQQLPQMHYQRAFHNSVVLPDGKVLIMGGQVRTVNPTLTLRARAS